MRRLLFPVFCLFVAFAAQAHAMNDKVVIYVDRAKVMQVSEEASTVIIGNPLFADAVVRPNNILVVTGKTPGTSNMIVLGRQGETLAEYIIHVTTDQSDVVIMHKGTERYSFACTNRCENAPQIGDSKAYLENTLAQTRARLDISSSEAKR